MTCDVSDVSAHSQMNTVPTVSFGPLYRPVRLSVLTQKGAQVPYRNRLYQQQLPLYFTWVAPAIFIAVADELSVIVLCSLPHS